MTRIEEMEKLHANVKMARDNFQRERYQTRPWLEAREKLQDAKDELNAAMQENIGALLAVVRAAKAISIRRQPHMNGPGEARVEHGQSDRLIALQEALLPFGERQ